MTQNATSREWCLTLNRNRVKRGHPLKVLSREKTPLHKKNPFLFSIDTIFPQSTVLFLHPVSHPLFRSCCYLRLTMKEKYYFKKKTYEVPESKSLAPTSDTIISAVCEHYGVSFNELLITRRGIFNEPRNIAVYLIRQIRGENLNSIGELLNIEAYSTISSIIRRVSRLKKFDTKIKNQIGKIQDTINKGQRQTPFPFHSLSFEYIWVIAGGFFLDNAYAIGYIYVHTLFYG